MTAMKMEIHRCEIYGSWQKRGNQIFNSTFLNVYELENIAITDKNREMWGWT